MESLFSEGAHEIGYDGSGDSVTLDLSLPSRNWNLESKSHSENKTPYSRWVSTAGEYLFLDPLMGKISVWQPLIGGEENGDSGVGRGFDEPPPASSTCNSSLLVASPPAGPLRAQERLRTNVKSGEQLNKSFVNVVS